MYGFDWVTIRHIDTVTILKEILNVLISKNIVLYTNFLDPLDDLYCDLEDKCIMIDQVLSYLQQASQIMSIVIKAYPKNEFKADLEFNQTGLEFDVFLSSPCILAYYCFDCCEQQIFIKNKGLYESIKTILLSHGLEEFEEIYNPEEHRSWF